MVSKQIKMIYECLQDYESQTIFLNLLNKYLSEDLRHIMNRKYSNKDTKSTQRYKTSLDYFIYNYEFIDNNEKQPIFLFPANNTTKFLLIYLKSLNIPVKCFCDFDVEKQKDLFGGLPVLSPKDTIEEFKNAKILIGDDVNRIEGVEKLIHLAIKNGFNENQIKCPYSPRKDYFDEEIFKPYDNEIFIDGGSFDGDSILSFIKWCDKKYSKIYAIEPDSLNQNKLKKTISEHNLHNIKIIKEGLWNCSSKLKFNQQGHGASSINNEGNVFIKTNSIDNIIGNEHITLIKMDIEGAELEALKGAAITIRKNKPRLMISIYHKPQDILEIPIFILKLLPEYKFYIRHLAPSHADTILYATM